LPPFECSQQC